MKNERRCALLINMGGPSKLDEVEKYIRTLLSDPDMVRLPGGFFYQNLFAKIVSSRRAQKVKERYELIGGKSPILEETTRIAAKTEEFSESPVFAAMRYTAPSIPFALDKLALGGFEEVVAIPLFPQYSFSTTLSIEKELKRANKRSLNLRIVKNHFDNPRYIEAMTANLLYAMRRENSGLNETRVLFTAHSVPVSYTKNGDPYISQIERTAESIAAEAELTEGWSLAYQSQVGPAKWHGPALEEELARLASIGVKRLVVQPLSFATECLETLYDLDVVFKKQCAQAGIESFVRVPALAEGELYAQALAEIILNADGEGEQNV